MQEHEAQEVAISLADAQPVLEELRRGLIPCDGVPVTIEHVAGSADGAGQIRQSMRVFVFGARRGRVGAGSEPEEIGALGMGESQPTGEGSECLHRDGARAPLLYPGVPGRADPAQRRDLLAAQAGCAPPLATGQTEFLRLRPVSSRTQKVSK